MDAEKARKNVELFKTKEYQSFILKNKDKLKKLLDKISDLSKEGKREHIVKVFDVNDTNHITRYLNNLLFKVSVINTYDYKAKNKMIRKLRITW